MKVLWFALSVAVIAIAWLPLILVSARERESLQSLLFGSAGSIVFWLLPLGVGMVFASFHFRRTAHGCLWLIAVLLAPVVFTGYLLINGLGSVVPETHLQMGIAGAAVYSLQILSGGLIWLMQRNRAEKSWYFALAVPMLVTGLAAVVPAVSSCFSKAEEQRIEAVTPVQREAWASEILDLMGYQPYPGTVVIHESYINYPRSYSMEFSTSDDHELVLEFHRSNSDAAGMETFIYSDRMFPEYTRFAAYSESEGILLEIYEWGDTLNLSIAVDSPDVIRYWKKHMVNYEERSGSPQPEAV